MTEFPIVPMLKVENLRKSFGSLSVIDDLSFEVGAGERLLVLAASGSGKTTLLKILAGLMTSDKGKFTFQGVKNPVLLFQEARLFPHLTVLENILLPLTVHSQIPSREKQERISEWLNKLNLFAFKEIYPHHLSGGMKRKVSLLRAFITDPDFLLLDEPFQSLDADSKQTILTEILPAYANVPILFTTHDLMEIPLLATSILYFDTPYLGKPNRIGTASFEKIFTKGARL